MHTHERSRTLRASLQLRISQLPIVKRSQCKRALQRYILFTCYIFMRETRESGISVARYTVEELRHCGEDEAERKKRILTEILSPLQPHIYDYRDDDQVMVTADDVLSSRHIHDTSDAAKWAVREGSGTSVLF